MSTRHQATAIFQGGEANTGERAWTRDFAGPDDLVQLLLAGQPILLVGRNSGSGAGAMQLAARDVHVAAEALARRGCPLLEHLPSESELVERLRAAPSVLSRTREGRRFAHRFVEVDLSRQCGVHILIATGSGKKLDDDLKQPVSSRLRAIIRRIRPATLFAKRLDRITRSSWALGEAVLELLECGGFIGDARRGEFRRCLGLEALLVFWDASLGEDDAEKLPVQTRLGMHRGTSDRMEGEIAYVGSGMHLPAGLVRIRLKDGVGVGRPWVTFDRPASLPDPALVATGMPDVRDENGELVDQVENVRWVLRTLGQPGWHADAVAKALPERRFSTEGLRRKRGADAVMRYHPLITMRSIMANLEFYETGALPVRFGVDGIEDKVVRGVFPTDGPWATKRDFDRIRQYQAKVRQITSKRTKTAFTGLRCQVDGVDSVLASARVLRRHGQPMLEPVRADAWPYSRLTTGYRTVVPAYEIANAVVDAIADAGDRALELVNWDVDSDAAVDVRRKVADVRSEMDSVEEKRRRLRGLLDSVDENGQPSAFGALRRTYVCEFNDADSELEALTARQRALEAELVRIRQDELSNAGTVATDELLHLVASLRDPFDLSYRSVWLSVLRDLTITTVAVDRRQRTSRVTGGLVIGTGDIATRIDFDHTFTYVFRPDPVPARIDRVIAAMREGTPLPDLLPPQRNKLRRMVADRFGIDGAFLLCTCPDPRITRLVTALLHDHPELPVEDLAQKLDEPVALLSRVREVHGLHTERGRWLTRGAPVLAHLYEIAARRPDRVIPYEDVIGPVCSTIGVVWRTIATLDNPAHWERLGAAGIRLRRPCAHCGSWSLAPSRLREADGPICLACRHDRSGVEWPADPYDRWLTCPELWVPPAMC